MAIRLRRSKSDQFLVRWTRDFFGLVLSQAMERLQLSQVRKQRSVSVYTEQVAGVGLAHACTPAVVRGLNLGRVYDTPLLKVFQPAKQ